MRKTLIVPALLLLLVACTPEPELVDGGEGSLPYRVWQSWEEMKEVLGDHYLYPTYLPEVAMGSENPSLSSWYENPDRTLHSDELFCGYLAFFPINNRTNDSIAMQVTDYERQTFVMPRLSDLPSYHDRFRHGERFNEHTVTIGGVEIEFSSFYVAFHPQARRGRAVLCTFTIDTVTYRMSWVQYDVEDKYADDEQREGMLRVARSIIEQVMEVE